MSCSLAVAAALLLADAQVAASAAVPAVAQGAPVSVAAEPLFADIVARSVTLKAVVDDWIAADSYSAEAFAAFRPDAEALAERDMQGHLVLKQRGVDGDLKCILRGLSEDLPKRLDAIAAAPSAAERRVALSELAYLLDDNAAVITSPPQPAT